MSIERALQDSQARLMGIIASAMDAIISIDPAQRIVLFNRAAELMFGYPAEEMIGKPLDLLIPERFRERHRAHIRRFSETGVTSRTMGRLGTLYGLRSSGEEFPIEASISQVEAAEGKLYTVILRDVTERVKAEEKLIENEEYFRATFEQAAIGIVHMAPDGRYLRVNEKFCEMTGYSEEELLTKSSREVTHPQDWETDFNLHNQMLAGQFQTYTLEKRFVRKDGATIWSNLSASLVRDRLGKPKYLIKVIEDITQRKAAEAALQARTEEIQTMSQQLWQTAKLATMGELAASIAHELNNPLAILSLRIESLLARQPDSGPDRRELEVMEQEVERMASLVANLLQFSRSGQRQVSSMDLCEEIERTLELIHNYLAHRRINVRWDCGIAVPMIQADRQQMRQLFLNLFTNASDAMPDGGDLTIRVQPVDGTRAVSVDVTDTGVGIKPEDLAHVLDPFYTTKKEGKGTGLGLSICRRIVEEHSGVFEISSPGVNQGARVHILLPIGSGSKPGYLEEE